MHARDTRARTHTLTHTHTYTHTHTHTHTHLRTHSRTHARARKPNTARKTKEKCTTDCNQLQLTSKQILLLFYIDSSETSVVMVKFLADTPLEGLIEISDESAYRGQIGRLAGWCSENDLELNVSKTKRNGVRL